MWRLIPYLITLALDAFAGGYISSGTVGGVKPASQKTERAKQSLRPVTIKQILNSHEESPSGPTLVDGVPVTRVSLVAVIRDIKKYDTVVIYRIEDGTGVFDLKRFIGKSNNPADDGDKEMRSYDDEGNDENETEDPYEVGQYIYVQGSTKVFNEERRIQIQTMRRVEDHNEVIFHLLDAIKAYKYLVKGETGGVGGNDGNSNSLFLGGSQNDPEAIVLQAIKKYRGDGVNSTTLAYETKLPVGTIDKIIESLSEQGHIFNGDEDTYIATDIWKKKIL